MFRIILPAIAFIALMFSILPEALINVDLKSLLLVSGGAVIFSLTGESALQRISLFGEGAVVSAWIGFIAGSISILSHMELQTSEWYASLNAAFAIALTTLLYGYLLKAITTLITNQMRD